MSAAETGICLDSFTARSEPDTEAYLARYDSTETPASMAVVAVVSRALGRGPADLSQIYYAVDAEALDELLSDDGVTDGLCVTFAYEGFDVTVTAEEVVAVRPIEDAETDARGGESGAA